jgi:6-pyruvoyltetrahydropterin/6-carboxytetrahydropterin synthase
MRLVKRFSFDAAHHLPNYEGACNRVHGHMFICELTVAGKYDEKSGMICDFSKLKKLINNNVVDILDHNEINNVIENPTAENIVNWIFDALVEDLDRVGLAIAEIRLWESPDSSVVLNPYEELEYNLDDEE